MSVSKPTISVLMNTRNEDRNLPYALRSVQGWVDEIVVVDMESTDRTREIAQEFGARVYLHEPLGFADPARAFGLAQTTGTWVLILDADELISEGLSTVLLDLASQDRFDAIWLPRLNYVFGDQMHATGWGPAQDRQLRFFKRDAVELTATVHDFTHLRAGARVMTIEPGSDVALVHFNYTSARHFVEKTNRYTSIEADQAVAAGVRASTRALLWAPIREFLRLYVYRRGYRDGWRGFHLASFMAFYRFLSVAKRLERERAGTEAEIDEHYREEAEAWLAPSGPRASS